MNEDLLLQIKEELEIIKKLLALQLKNQDVKGDVIARAMGISEGRLSQMIPQKKYKKTKKNDSK